MIDFEYYPNIERRKEEILDVLDRCGTPIFICERDNLVARFRELERSLSTRWSRHIIGFSFKTNYPVAQAGILKLQGAWAEVVSGREYRLAQRCGYRGDQIIFNGPYKTDEELRRAISARALLNVNDHDELDRIIAITEATGERAEIGLRLGATLPRLGQSRFGFSLENSEAVDALRRIERAARVALVGIHLHLYSDTDDAELYRAGVDRVGRFLEADLPHYRRVLRWINLGGGFPAHILKPRSRTAWNPQPIDTYIAVLTEALRVYFPDEHEQPILIVEPGRYLTSDGIIFVSQVVHIKKRGGKRIVNCNGSISMIPLTHYCPQIIVPYSAGLERREENSQPTIIHGSTCRENDILYEGLFPEPKRGDYLIHFGVGAYNSNLSPDFIFETPSMEVI